MKGSEIDINSETFQENSDKSKHVDKSTVARAGANSPLDPEITRSASWER